MNVTELKNLGNNEFKNGNYETAIKYFTDAIDQDNNNHILYSNRSAAYLSSGNGDKALEDANKCIELDPSWIKGLGRKGAALHMLKKYEESIQAFEEGLDKEPDNMYLKSGLELVKNEKEMKNNQPNFSMDLMQQLMQNDKLKEKMRDPSFISKIMEYQTNPLSMMQDKEMMEVFGSIMQEMNSSNSGSTDIILSDEDTDEESEEESEEESDEESDVKSEEESDEESDVKSD